MRTRLNAIRCKLRNIKLRKWPTPNVNPNRWYLFLMDVHGCESSIYMMKCGAHIPLTGHPYLHNPATFLRLEKWQQVAALEVVYKYVKEGKVLGPFPGDKRKCPITGTL